MKFECFPSKLKTILATLVTLLRLIMISEKLTSLYVALCTISFNLSKLLFDILKLPLPEKKFFKNKLLL